MKEKTNNKKHILYIVLIVPIIVLSISFIIIKFPLIYAFDEYMIWNGEGVKDDGWKELIYSGSFVDRVSVKPLMDKAEEAFSAFPPSEEEAYKQFGKLGKYCMTTWDNDVVSEQHSLKLISANVDQGKGYLWVRYSQQGYYKNNEFACGTLDVNSRWTIEKNSSGEWVVTGIHEHP